MKKTLIYVAMAAAALTTACTNLEPQNAAGDDNIRLTLRYDAPAMTRTAGEGLENTVTSVDYFFYTDTTANAVYSYRDDNPTVTDGRYTISFTAGADGMPDLNVLFNNKKSEFFAVFNAPEELENAPLSDIKATVLANTFAHEGTEAGTSTGSKWVVTQDAEAADFDKYFVMTGQETLTREGNVNVSGEVDMKRVAAKVGVDLMVKKSVTDKDGNTWEPMREGNKLRIYLQNAAGSAVIGGADVEPSFPDELNQFTYKEIYLDCSLAKESGDYYLLESQQDFYTFPMEWTQGGDQEPFVKIIVPWQKTSGATSQKEIYYKVMIPATEIVANTYYKMTVYVSLLGTEGEPEVTLEPLSAQVVGWQEGGDVNPVISAAKYLSVEKQNVTFYTATSGTDYAASDLVTVKIIEIKQQNLTTGDWEYLYQNGTANTTQITKRGFTQAIVESEWVRKVGDNYLQIGHQLNSDLTSTLMDVTPYYYTVVLSLPEDIDPDGEYDKEVTFIQYPEVYVVEDPNSDGKSNANYGYAFLNTYTGDARVTTSITSGGWYHTTTNYYTDLAGGPYYVTNQTIHSANYIGGIHGLAGNNKNENMYVLTISVSSTYTIGDPRSSSSSVPSFTYSGATGTERSYNIGYGQTIRAYDNGSSTLSGEWRSAPWVQGGSHILTYYHPAASENTSNMIAPKIRVASSYGVCTTGITRQNAIARCAAYQEDGIPAGRWRLPTMAEVQFIGTLSSLGRIPYLFGSSDDNGDAVDEDSFYWTANGLIYINNGKQIAGPVSNYDVSVSGEAVRCVYDEWFWGDATTNRPLTNKSQFTWGDRNY